MFHYRNSTQAKDTCICQQSSRITFPFKPLIESGSEFAQMKISLNSGAGMAGTILNLLCLL